jgi:DNA-binding transcriptional LysR family regulator
MKVTHVETIVAIAEAGSLRAAARSLRKSQPALTKTLKQAEEELGAKIFARAARGVEPTEIGRKVIARARMISSEFRKLDEDIRQIQGDGSGNLHVIVSPLAAVRIVPKVMDRFRKQFPDVHLQVAGGHPPGALAVLRSGEADLVIGPVPARDDRAGLTIRNLVKTPVVVITGKGSRYADATRHEHPVHHVRPAPVRLPQLRGASASSHAEFRPAGGEMGVRFSEAYVQSPICGASRMSFYTGATPPRTARNGTAFRSGSAR